MSSLVVGAILFTRRVARVGLSSLTSIRVWESGIERPRNRLVPRLAAVLGVEPADFTPGVRSDLA
jgi:hypothetical protein